MEPQLELTPEEEYRIWKKNSCFLYEIVLSHTLEWPTLTLEWLPGKEAGKKFKKQQIVFGTHTSGQDDEWLFVADVTLPILHTSERTFNPKLDIVKRISHTGEVCRARHMPSNKRFIATKTSKGTVALFDTTKEENNYLCSLTGNTSDGYGLEWNKIDNGVIASCGEDKRLCIWKLDMQGSQLQQPERIIQLKEKLEDLSWSKFTPSLIGVVGDSTEVRLFDLREKGDKPINTYEKQHANCIYGLDFHPFQDHLFATCSGDSCVKLWDIRQSKVELASLENHVGEVYNVRWSPLQENMLASSGQDRRVMMWDICRIGMEQSSDDARDGPPELLFVHAGHMSGVSDISWSPNKGEDWLIASAADNNYMQVWEIIDQIYNEDSKYPVEDEDLEDLE